MVKIRLSGTVEATLEAGHWHCADARTKRLLNAMRATWQIVADAQLESSEAAVVSKILGAEIIKA